ncbi:MAG: Haloacid dehalogenase, IB family protein [Parcubacteria group bacterium Athens0714_25]|nr:MAG: Haloacid dehalogenase, IB family protein [Parcubacteria group bacterium Athens0714_25]
MHFELINELVWMKVFPRDVREDLTRLYTGWLEHEGTYEEYRLKLVDLYNKHIVGKKREDVAHASNIVVPFHKNRTYVFAENLIKKLRAENFCIIAISGSPIEIVEEFNREHLNFDKVFGSMYELDENGYYTGKMEFEPTMDKGQVVRQYVFENNLTLDGSYGLGDAESDASFLELVDNPIAFNPNHNLKSIAEKKNWKIVVEKKDVIYDIQ